MWTFRAWPSDCMFGAECFQQQLSIKIMARPVSSCLSCRTYKSENYIFIDLYQIYLGARVIVLNVEEIAKPVRSMTCPGANMALP